MRARLILIFWFLVGSLSFANMICEEHLMKTITCKDLLYRVFPVAPDVDVERMRNYCYVLCSQIRILEIRSKKSTSLEEKKSLDSNLKQLKRFLQVGLIALRAGYFVFGPMKFRAFLSETQLRRKAES
jgi:hypothetical protein